jgi:hypothetical protein
VSLLWIKTASKSGEDLARLLSSGHPDAPDSDFQDNHEAVAHWLGVHPREVSYTLEHHPMSDFGNRGTATYSDPDEHEYIKGMANHLRSGGALPPGLAADVHTSTWNPRGKEPVTIVDGNHRAAAHAEAGSETMPLWVGRAK